MRPSSFPSPLHLALLAVVTVLLAVALAACGDDDGDAGAAPTGEPAEAGQWPAFFDLPSLIEASDVIVVAQLGEERTETIEAPTVEGSDATDTITEIVRTFAVEESLKGDLQPGDLVNVFNTASVATDPGDGSAPVEDVFQVLKIERDQSYLLFLTLVEVPGFYPEELGDFGWAAPGEPHTARVLESGRLEWETTGRYDRAMEERGIEPGESGAGPAFDSTLQLVATLAQGGGVTPSDSEGASPSPAE